MSPRDDLLEAAAQAGFTAAGFSQALPPPHLPNYLDWVRNGRHAGMAYLASERSLACRADPLLLQPSARTVFVAAAAYTPPEAGAPTDDAPFGRLAAYARARDYHDAIPPMLDTWARLAERILGRPIARRPFTDAVPLLERDFAQRAGLGWAGKNTCLILPGRGSYQFLAEALVDAEIEPTEPFQPDRCGSCTRCVDACPTGCIRPDRTLDAGRCISYLTIENKGAIPAGLRPQIGEWVFGCDVCQMVCPWNRRASAGLTPPELQPVRSSFVDLIAEVNHTPQTFKAAYANSPILRAKRRGWLRNVSVALGNRRDPRAVSALIRLLEADPEALARGHAAWALGQIASPAARSALERSLQREDDPNVLSEISSALAATAGRQ